MVDVLEPTPTPEPEPDPEERSTRGRTVLLISLAVAAVVVLLVVVFAKVKGGAPDTAATPLIDEPAPTVQATTIDGKSFNLADRKGSWVVVNFFATWCPPCVQEHPELLRFQQGQAGQADGAELVTVVNNDDPATVRKFFAANGGNWPVLEDPNGAIYVSFGVAKVPETWIIDPNGYVRARIITTVSADGLAKIVNQLKTLES
jgi:cytochrome c biogenesis protein CcmG/thiol:disulfide interchange protein DsbE